MIIMLGNSELEIPSAGVIIAGVLLASLITLLLATLLALLLMVVDLNQDLVGGLLMLFNYLAIFVGGFFCGKRIRRQGWLNGGMMGIAYMVLLLFLGRILLPLQLSSMIILRLMTGFISGGLGGMAGVNLK